MSITMYDSIYVAEIPANAKAVAGYIGGRWPTYPVLVKKFPNAHVLSIAVASRYDAECLDVEPGDATNAVAPAWVKRQLARGVKRPVVYTSVANARALLNELARNEIRRDQVRLWTAHYTYREHVCGSQCGFNLGTTADATQWTNKALGRTLDQSICLDSFFPADPRARKRPIWRRRQTADLKVQQRLLARLKVLAKRIARRKRLLG